MRTATGEEVVFEPFPYQADVITDLDAGGPLIVNKGRQIGFSTCTMLQKLRRVVQQPGLTVLVVSRKADLAIELIDRARFGYKTLRGPKPAVAIDNRMHFELDNGSRIIGETANEDAGRTYAASDVVFDEFAHCAWQEEMWRSVRPTVAQAGGNIAVVSTPNGEGDKFHELWLGATAGVIEGEGRCEKDGSAWRAYRLTWRAQPNRDDAWLAAEKADYTEADWQQEFECDFLSAAAAIFSAEHIAACAQLPRLPRDASDTILGVDIAGEGRDYSVLTLLDATQKPYRILWQQAHEELGAKALQLLIEKRASENGARVGVDGTGLGWGVSENLAVPHTRVIFTGGSADTKDGNTWRVPREKLLVNAVQVVERHELAIDPNLQELVTALRTARWEKGKGSYVDHLDSLLIALWLAEQKGGEVWMGFA